MYIALDFYIHTHPMSRQGREIFKTHNPDAIIQYLDQFQIEERTYNDKLIKPVYEVRFEDHTIFAKFKFFDDYKDSNSLNWNLYLSIPHAVVQYVKLRCL